MGFPIATTVSAASAAASAVAAFFSWYATRRASAAAERANATADAVARIERDRRHKELRPQLEIGLREHVGSYVLDQGVLRLQFPGPAELDPYGPITVTVTVRDDRDRSLDHTRPGGLSKEKVAAQVWGPWRLQPLTDGADAAGRTAKGRAIRIGEELLSVIERTRSPHSEEGAAEMWSGMFDGKPMRLRIEVQCDGLDPWVFLEEFTPDAK